MGLTKFNPLHLFTDDDNNLNLDMIAEGLQGFMTNVDDNKNQGLTEVYEFFTRYVRRIRPDKHWKSTMKINLNEVFFQLVTSSDIAFVISLLKNGMPVWK